MRQILVLCSPLAAFLLATSAHAVEWYVSPTGTATSGCTTRANPCSLGAAANGAMAGDTVILMDGVYKEALFVSNSGTESAWITFKADKCATPIIEGQGVGPDDENQDTGVHSTTGQYLRFEGIVARGWNIGFGNAWAGGTAEDRKSNGNWEIKHCISYSNGRTGFTFFSAENFKLINSISAHNGSNTKQSWSSGVTLFEAEGTNLVQGVVSFENTDEERHTDGSGFIVDEESNNATFINNIAFGNSGSCFRLTRSSGTKFINNTCYHNSQFGNVATGPTNPGEIYFTNGGVTQQGVLFKNNVIVGTGQAPAGSTPVVNQPQSGWTNNVVRTGNVNLFKDPTGMHPDFSPADNAMDLIGKGSAGEGAPTEDIGFDPKCIIKRTPKMVGMVRALPNWQYDVNIEYIQSIGGVAACFNPGMRGGTPDIGAYKSGAVATAGTCEPPMDEPPVGTGGTGGVGGADGGGVGGAATGGTGGGSAGEGGGAGGTAGVAPTGGQGGVMNAGGQSQGGTDPGVPGTAGQSTGTAGAPTGPSTAGTGPVGVAGNPGVAGGAGAPPPAPASEEGGCGCRTAPQPGLSGSLAALGLLGLGAIGLKRRRRARQ